MSTNYYYRYDFCDHCGRYEELHIGKATCGYPFLFRGHNKFTTRVDGDVVIASWLDWQRWFNTHPGKIYCETGAICLYGDFARLVGPPRIAVAGADEWRDGQGYNFRLSEFE